MSTRFWKFVALALISGFLVFINWSDFGPHDCYSRFGCPTTALEYSLSYAWYVAPFLLVGSLALAMIGIGFRGLTNSERGKYVLFGICAGIVALMSLYFYALWTLPTPGATTTINSTTTVG